MAIRDAFDDHRAVITQCYDALLPQLEQAAERLAECVRDGGKILACGNGGSAADAQHFAAELVGRYERDRRGLGAVALSTDTSALTSIANDYGFEQVFARQVEALARPGDALLAITTSGRSANVLLAARRARELGCIVVGLTGSHGGDLVSLADVCLMAPSQTVARIQEVHELCLHALAQHIERSVG